jgi:hypothetical protein
LGLRGDVLPHLDPTWRLLRTIAENFKDNTNHMNLLTLSLIGYQDDGTMLRVMVKNDISSVIAERIRHLGTWLDDEAPYVQFDQRHLDAGTPERAYWHLGYRTALRDALALIKSDTESTPDTASRSPSADRDE